MGVCVRAVEHALSSAGFLLTWDSFCQKKKKIVPTV